MSSEIEKENTGTEEAEMLKEKKILFVDDDVLILKTMERSVRSALKNIEVKSANSGRKAIELIEKGDEPDIIVSDVMMPNGTGKDLYEWLCINRPELAKKIFFISGGAVGNGLGKFFQEMLENGRLFGAGDFLGD